MFAITPKWWRLARGANPRRQAKRQATKSNLAKREVPAQLQPVLSKARFDKTALPDNLSWRV